ncbi:MAG: TVP38/TMEM64 family protein [Mariprofundales bacterium]
MKKLFIGLVLVITFVILFIYYPQEWRSLEGLKGILQQLYDWQQSSPFIFIIYYFALYVFIAVLAIPGAVFITLAGGALFGLWWGTLLVSFASSIGAAGAFLLSRYIFHDAFQQRFAHKLAKVQAGIERDGAYYLFGLRLAPIFPFFLVNILMGLSTIRLFTFYLVSQIGMLPLTFIYVNAGTQLAQLESLSDFLDPSLLLALTALAVLPLGIKFLLAKYARANIT